MLTRTSWSSIVVISFVAWTAACGPESSPPAPPLHNPDVGIDAVSEPDVTAPLPMATIEIVEQPIIVELNQTRQLIAVVSDETGATVQAPELRWASSDESILRVTDQGVAIGRSLGVATITVTATAGATTLSATAEGRVVGKAVAEVELIPRQRTLAIEETVELFVTLRDSNRAVIDEERPIEWESSAPDIVSIEDGLATALAPGLAELVAIVEGVRSEPASFTVVGVSVERMALGPASSRLVPDDEVQLEVILYDLEDNVLTNRTLTFSTSDDAVATVNPSGLVTARAVGSATITAESGGKSATMNVEVHLDFDSVVAGGHHSCGLIDRIPFCWGANDNGQLGRGTTSTSEDPARLDDSPRFEVLSLGDTHTCGLADHKAYCWGNGDDGRLGNGQTTRQTTPVAVSGEHRFVAISAGHAHTCAIDESQRLWCWGKGDDGQLGNGQLASRTTPVQISGNHSVLMVSAGGAHTCFATTTNNGFCFGANDSGQLGTQNTTSYDEPTFIPGGYTYVLLEAGREHTCGISPTGIASCFGANSEGQIGDGTTANRTTPIYIPLPQGVSLTTLSAGDDHTCGLAAGGAIYCWGKGDGGQLGDGQQQSSTDPVQVSTTLSPSGLTAGGAQTCAVANRKVYCWGTNPAHSASAPTLITP